MSAGELRAGDPFGSGCELLESGCLPGSQRPARPSLAGRRLAGSSQPCLRRPDPALVSRAGRRTEQRPVEGDQPAVGQGAEPAEKTGAPVGSSEIASRARSRLQLVEQVGVDGVEALVARRNRRGRPFPRRAPVARAGRAAASPGSRAQAAQGSARRSSARAPGTSRAAAARRPGRGRRSAWPRRRRSRSTRRARSRALAAARTRRARPRHRAGRQGRPGRRRCTAAPHRRRPRRRPRRQDGDGRRPRRRRPRPPSRARAGARGSCRPRRGPAGPRAPPAPWR